jgi:hypothetical protein
VTKPILNLSRSCHISRKQAESRIEARTAVWVIEGKSIRELSLAEILASRIETPADRNGLCDTPCLTATNELPGLKWEPPAYDRYAILGRRPILLATAQFLREGQCTL